MPTKEYVASIWSVQESLLQTYRTIFVAIQTFLIAAAVSLIHDDFTAAIAVFILGGLGLWIVYQWPRITDSRSKNVRLLQAVLVALESGKEISDGVLRQMLSHQRDEKMEDSYRSAIEDFGKQFPKDKAGPSHFFGYLPKVFIIIWMLVFFAQIISYPASISIFCSFFEKSTRCIS